jgi:hypothetical protein
MDKRYIEVKVAAILLGVIAGAAAVGIWFGFITTEVHCQLYSDDWACGYSFFIFGPLFGFVGLLAGVQIAYFLFIKRMTPILMLTIPALIAILLTLQYSLPLKYIEESDQFELSVLLLFLWLLVAGLSGINDAPRRLYRFLREVVGSFESRATTERNR